MRFEKTSKILLACLLVAQTAVAAPKDAGQQGGSKDWEYPELQVTPRASERIEREARWESRAGWRAHAAIEVSALATLTSGLLQLGNTNLRKDPSKYAALTGIGVGGGWLVTSWLLASQYRPYGEAATELGAMPKSTTREQLTRERAAEETIEEAARLGARLRWLSFISNLATSAYMAGNAENGSFARTADVASAVLAFSPLLFPSRWILVERDQQDYKKRIFAPVASTTLIRTSASSLSPALALTWGF